MGSKLLAADRHSTVAPRDAPRPRLVLLALSLSLAAGIQIFEIVQAGSVDGAIAIGPPVLGLGDTLRDVLLAVAMVGAVLAFPSSAHLRR